MKALIMAGGEGTRLRPLTCNRPKPMVPVMNKPVMEHIIQLLKQHNITEIGVTLQYMPQIIREYFGDGSDLGVNIRYYVEESPLGTAGSVKNAEEFLDDTFIVISGDALTDINLSEAIAYHQNNNAVATLVLARVDVPLEYGVVVTDNHGKITRFLEKPSWSEVFSDTVNTGIYILNPGVLAYFNAGEKFDFSKDLFPLLMEDEQPMYGYVAEGYWCDIGDLSAYQQCHFDILDGKVNIPNHAREIAEKVWVEDPVEIADTAQITGPVLIGSHTKIKDYAAISDFTVIGSDNIIGEYSSFKRTILWKGCNIGQKVQLRGCTLCNKVQVKEASSVFEQSVVGGNTVVKERAVVKPGIKIWPSKTVESDTEINVNLVWGAKYSKMLFGEKGILGEVNVDLTPEFASRLGASFGALFKNDGKIGISVDETNASDMLKSSFIAGLLSAGIDVYDFGQQILPIMRAAVTFYGLDGGIHLGTATQNNDLKLLIDFLDGYGVNINRAMERKLENIFTREDFYRCEANKIGKVNKIQDFKSYYLRDTINKMQHKDLHFKVLMNGSSKLIESLGAAMLKELNCEIGIRPSRPETAGIGYGSGIAEEIGGLSKEVVTSGADIGVFIEKNGEKMILIDEKGKTIAEEMFMTLVALITLETVKNATIIVPISAPSVIDVLAEQYGGKVLRTKTSPLEVMGQMVSNGQEDIALNHQFILNFDAIGGLVRIMDFMKAKDIPLSALVERIPSFYMSKKEVECPWNVKGKVIRKIIEENEAQPIELMEGVKIYQDGGWVLVLPDAEKAVCKVIGEGYSEEFAESITDHFAVRVKEIGQG